MTERTHLSLRIDSDIRLRLEQLANQDNRSLNNYVELILKQHVGGKSK